jgi:hypothetical protein
MPRTNGGERRSQQSHNRQENAQNVVICGEQPQKYAYMQIHAKQCAALSDQGRHGRCGPLCHAQMAAMGSKMS